MKSIPTLFGIALSLILFSFTPIDYSPTGKYSSQLVSLDVHADNTFTYIDNSNSANKIAVNGTWKLVNNSIVLDEYESTKKIHSKWNVDKTGIAIKSRKGLAFYRLVKEGSCN